MKIKELYYINTINNSLAIEYVIKYHYLHRRPNTQKSFGLFEKTTNELIGVIIYGTCASQQLRKNMFGEQEKDNIYELTRLWIKDGTPKNTESYFIGNTLKLLDKEIVISFADPSANHVGTIYQACNFYYTGLSKKTKNLYIRGHEDFNKSNFNVESVSQIKSKYGENSIYYEDRIRKHRYFYLNCKLSRRNELLSKLIYSLLPYPTKEPQNIIYGLFDPPELGGNLRYVGQSSIGIIRAHQHKKPSLLKTSNHKVNWIKSLINQDKTYQVQILEDLGIFEDKKQRDVCLNNAEIRLISFHKDKGCNLTNSTEGGEGTRGNILSNKSKKLISEKRKIWYQSNDIPKHLYETCYKKKDHKIIEGIEYKHCSDCDSFKKLIDYGLDKLQWDELRTVCKTCSQKRKREHYKKTTVKLTEEQIKESYKLRTAKMQVSIKKKYETDPTYKEKASKVKRKAIIGISVTNPNDLIEFESAIYAYEVAGFNNTYISTSIKTGKPYKGYYWKFK